MLETYSVKEAVRKIHEDPQVQVLSSNIAVSPKGQTKEGASTEQLLLHGVQVSASEAVRGLRVEQGCAGKVGKKRTRVAGEVGGISNVLSVYSRADRWDIEFGMNAYENYHKRIAEVADKYWLSRSIACGVFAALSPNIDEANNFLGLERLLAGESDERIPGYPLNKAKARMILNGRPPLDVLRGLKVRAFYDNLVLPRTSKKIVVDAHVYSVWVLKRFLVQEVPRINVVLNERISDDFRIAAELVSVRPSQLQAVCWSVWKRVNNIVFDSQIKMFQDCC